MYDLPETWRKAISSYNAPAPPRILSKGMLTISLHCSWFCGTSLCQKSFWPYVKNHSASKLVVLPQLLIWISYPALQLPHSWEVSEDSLPIEAPPPPPVWWWLIMGKPSGQKCEKSWNWWTTREWNNTLPMHGWSGRLIWKGPLVGWHIQKTCKIC